jgi:hypothetical protein
LSLPRRTLIRIMQSVNYGAILNVTVVNGELSFDPQPEILVDVRLDEEVRPRAEMNVSDFSLGVEVLRLLSQIDALKNGTIEKIVVHGGLPRRMTLRRSAQEARQ